MALAEKFGTGIRRLTTLGAARNAARLCKEVGALEPSLSVLSDENLRARADDLRARARSGTSLDDLLPEAFAVVREAGKRVIRQRAFDVQVMGGIALHFGMIAEMKTGEGKTLAATMPAFLNALTGKGVHVVTVNDYLVKRDAEWMGKIYKFLGMTVGMVTSTMPPDERRKEYEADITYAVHVEAAFDYLRDNMRLSLDGMAQRDLEYVIIDEVDSVLIDEARMPIEIMHETDESPDTCYAVDRVVRELDTRYMEIDEKKRKVQLSDEGIDRVEQMLRDAELIKSGQLYDPENIHLVHLVSQALLAHHVYKPDRDYVIKDNDIVLIDEIRGRMLVGRRLAEGLHEALEAKEQLPLRRLGVVVAQITYQNFFRLYRRIAGMTGTATVDAEEYEQIYRIQILEIPTNLPMIRKDLGDEIYFSEDEKLKAIVARVKERHARGQPVLVGTTSIGKSEVIAAALQREGIPHQILNARHHDREAEIIANAGRLGAVTIATNMAGRGTDIQLGGNLDLRLAQELEGITDEAELAAKTSAVKAEVMAEREAVRNLGGLLILGTERFFCRRIDDQLIGRAGRQGDPGESVFMLSLDDDLIRIFGRVERLKRRLKKIGHDSSQAMLHSWLSQAIRRAQNAVEEMFVESRMHVLDYDDVSNAQRKMIYSLRREIMTSDNLAERLTVMRQQVVDEMVERRMPQAAYHEQWDLVGLKNDLLDLFNLVLPVESWAAEEGIANEEMRERVETAVSELWRMQLGRFADTDRHRMVQELSLSTLDDSWRMHIGALEHLRFGIALRAYAQLVPLYEYKVEAFAFFETMLLRYRDNLVRAVARMVPVELGQKPVAAAPSDGTFVARHVKRLGPCPCGSGKRFKDCHGLIAASVPPTSDADRSASKLALHSSEA